MQYIKSKRIYFEDGVKDGYLIIEGKKIVGFVNSEAVVDQYLDYGNNRIIPGIVDTHNHGTYGYELDKILETDELTKENIRNYMKALTYEGVTSGLPTVTDTMKCVGEVYKEGYVGARMLGVHSEGPYLNRVGENGRPNPHPDIDLAYVKQLYEDSQGLLKLMAMAPEIPGSDKAKDYLLSKGVKLAYAHSDLKSKGAREAIDSGYRVATHTSNVMTGIHHRDIGGLGVMLMDPRVQCEVICDGLHVNLDFIEMMFKIKDKSQFMMISDSVGLAGIAPGRYDTGWLTPLNVSEEGFLRDDDGRLLGSSKSVLYGVGNLVEKVHIPMEEVIKLCSLNAASYYGFGDVKGSIKIGKDADFVVISDDYKALSTFVEGDKVFDRSIQEPKFDEQNFFR
ncbi:MAG: amidohydrolase family protein [Erysipelotrichaceae bacterium]